MTLTIILAITAVGAFGFIAYRHGFSAAFAAFVALGSALWAAVHQFAGAF